MPQSLRHIKSRIKSIESTKKLTRAMEMISVSKLKKTQNLYVGSRTYTDKMSQLLKRVISSGEGVTHPLMTSRKGNGKVAVCVIASDTGLCGSYNINVLRAAEKFIGKYKNPDIELITVGRKASTFFKKKDVHIIKTFMGQNGRYGDELRDDLLDTCVDLYTSGRVDEIFMVYTVVETASHHPVLVEKFLNFEPEKTGKIEYISEPDMDMIVNEVIPIYLTNKVRSILLHAFTAEHHARTLSMGEATHNAVELLEKLIMQHNKIRQANITNEVIEIIASAEALKR